MNAKTELARRVSRQVTLADEYRLDIRHLIDKYEGHHLEGLLPEGYLPALKNCLDVAGGPRCA